ncbi:hypothetical protein EXS66_00770 [Candidatus Saccharibacteria bacterium]|nr:hypothetical protein [Candidatus Saccharibacteria bacterium]
MKISKLVTRQKCLVLALIIALQLINVPIVKANSSDPFCRSVVAISSKISSDIQHQQLFELDNIKAGQSKLDSRRTTANSKRLEHFDKLDKKYFETEQAEHLSQYKQVVQGAITARRLAVDKARAEFISSANLLIIAHRDEIVQSEQILLTSLATITKTAQDNCGSGMDPMQVKSVFKSSLGRAKLDLINAVQTQPSNKQKLNLLITIRKQSIDEALAEFKVTAFDAKQKFLDATSQQ